MTRVNTQSRFIEMYSKCQKNSLSSIASSWDKGQAFKKESIVDKGTTQCIHYGELFTKYGPIIDKVLSTTNEEAIKVSKKGDILFPASDVTPNGLARCSAVMLDKVLLGGDIIVLRLSDGVVPEYISYAINMQKEQLIRRVTGSVVRHLSSKNLASVTLPVPSLGEQVMFVKIIRKADKSKFNGFKSRFIEMFGDDKWAQKSLGEVGSFTRGGGFQKSDFVEDGIPCIHYGQIHTRFGPFISSHITEISSELASKTRFASKGDLIIAITSEDAEGSCKSTAWLGDYPVAVGAHAAIYNHCMNPLYMSFFFKSALFNHAKMEYIHGTKVVEIRPDDIAKILVPCPPMSLQEQFAAIAEQSDKSKFELKQAIEKIDKVLRSLLQ